jgi:hypothetical protein
MILIESLPENVRFFKGYQQVWKSGKTPEFLAWNLQVQEKEVD